MINQIQLSNGLKIITERVPDVHSASLSVLMGVGSSYENKEISGISHFIEHLMFKGTKNRTSQMIAQLIEEYGGSVNAFTEKEHTTYYARVLTDQINLTVDIFCDMLLNSLFDQNELELERQVILEEIKMYDDTPDELVYEVMFKSIWNDNPFSLSVTGLYESVNSLNKVDIINFVNQYYTPDNLIFSISGNFDQEQLIDTIHSFYDTQNTSIVHPVIPKPVMQPSLSVCYKEIEQAHLCLVTNGVSILSDERYPLAILDIALAGGISSRLFQEIREKRGLSYSINSYKALYKPAGLFGVYAGTSTNNVNEVLKLILDEFAKVREEGLTEDELIRSKKQLKGSMLLGLESTYYRAYRNAHSLSYFGQIYTIEEVCQEIDNITLDDIKQLAVKIFNPDYYSLAVVGPKSLPEEFSFPNRPVMKACS